MEKNENNRTISIYISKSKSLPKTIWIIRKLTEESMADIKIRIDENKPILEYAATDDEGLAKIIRLYQDLTKAGDSVKLFWHQRETGIIHLRNLQKTYAEIDEESDIFPD